MARRRLTTFLSAVLAAVVVGTRDATGLAPPAPIFVSEEIHWLAPGRDRGDDPDVRIAEAGEGTPEVVAQPAPPRPPGSLLARAMKALLAGLRHERP